MCRKGGDGKEGPMHAGMSLLVCRCSLKGAVLAAESDLQKAIAGQKRKQSDFFDITL